MEHISKPVHAAFPGCVTLAPPSLPWAGVKCSGECLKERNTPLGHLEGEGVGTAHLWPLAPEADLLLYCKIMPVSGWMGIMAVLGRSQELLSPRWLHEASSTPAAQGCCTGWWRVARRWHAIALSLHVPDKSLY